MKKMLILVLMTAAMVSGCSARARLYAVQGPLAAQTPSPVYTAKFTGLENSGSMTIVTATGEVCTGRWTRVNAPPAAASGAGAAAADSTKANTMVSAWDAVYGAGFYTAHVLGSALYGQGVVTGNHGTVLNVEFFRPAAGPNTPLIVRGVAQDNQGNLFKLVF